MGIYERDNIPYQNIIDSMIKNRQAGAKIKSDNWRKQGEIWSNVVKELGSMAGRTMDAYQAQGESPEARLAALEEERKQAEIEQKYNEQVAQRKAVEAYIDSYNQTNAAKTAARNMQGYRPLPNMDGYEPAQGNNLFGMEEFYRRGGIY